MASNSTARSGVGIPTILFIIFLVLKLAKVGSVASWSWVWVFSPLWISMFAYALLLLVVVIFGLIVKKFAKKWL